MASEYGWFLIFDQLDVSLHSTLFNAYVSKINPFAVLACTWNKCMNFLLESIGGMYDTQREIFSESCKTKSNLNYTFPTDLSPNRIPFGAKSENIFLLHEKIYMHEIKLINNMSSCCKMQL